MRRTWKEAIHEEADRLGFAVREIEFIEHDIVGGMIEVTAAVSGYFCDGLPAFMHGSGLYEWGLPFEWDGCTMGWHIAGVSTGLHRIDDTRQVRIVESCESTIDLLALSTNYSWWWDGAIPLVAEARWGLLS